MSNIQSALVERIIAESRARGYITFDELNAMMPAELHNSEQIEDILNMLTEMGIQVIEAERS